MVSESPSKKRVIAIWGFHWQRSSSGMAVERSVLVMAMTCWIASCLSGGSVAMSRGVSDIVEAGASMSLLRERFR